MSSLLSFRTFLSLFFREISQSFFFTRQLDEAKYFLDLPLFAN